MWSFDMARRYACFVAGSINPTGVPVRGQNTGVRKPPSKATKRDQKAIEFNRALQGGNYNTMVV